MNYIRKDRFLIPTNNKHVVDYYKKSLLLPHNRREFMINLLKKHTPYLISSFTDNTANSNCIKVFDSNTIKELDSLLEDKLKLIFNHDINISHLILEGYKHTNQKQALFFHFMKNSNIPFAVSRVISCIKNNNEISQTNNEYLALQELNLKLSPEQTKTIPRVYEHFYENGFGILIQSVIEGRSMFYEIRNSLNPRNLIKKHLSNGVRWIINFQKQTKNGNTILDTVYVEEEIEMPLRLAADYIELSSNNKLIDEIEELSKNVYGFKIPIVSSHGDLWTRNFIVNENNIGVVDWEHYIKNSNPFYDFFMFIVSYGLFYPKSIGKWFTPEEAFDNFLSVNNYLSNQIRNSVIKYCGEYGFDKDILNLFFPVFLAVKCNEERDKITNNKEDSKNNYLWTKIFKHYIKEERLNYFG